MRIDLMTLFPEMCDRVMSESIVGRARARGDIEVCCHQIRDYTLNRQCQVDDYPYGGGLGMVLFPQPIADCFRAVCEQTGTRPHLIYMTPQGKTLTQKRAVELSKMDNLCILCGHYEGIDERVIEALVDEEISVGDYVLTGGELPALTLIDCVARLVPGVLSADECFTDESHFSGLLEYPQYTRPAVWEGREVPPILLSGHHANIQKWRREQAIERTARRRPDMLASADLTPAEKERVAALLAETALSDNCPKS
ncbi:MAG: tRNA (guanosine(37)-N1)-methyltransferase TrmD [Clostridia bacterium]|nr:tRNA (guanosine(37)-N1)-methyltransferase TrmD [Clostridia bacterium]